MFLIVDSEDNYGNINVLKYFEYFSNLNKVVVFEIKVWLDILDFIQEEIQNILFYFNLIFII